MSFRTGLSNGGIDVTVSDGASTTPAGWYPDPADSTRLRRWDGAAWTADVAPAAPVAQPEPPAAPVAPEPVPEPEPEPEAPSIPDWANMPGITLPPDLSGIPGYETTPSFATPAFDEPAREAPPASDLPTAAAPAANSAPPASQPGVPMTRRELRELRELQDQGSAQPAEAESQPPQAPPAEPQQSENYAPPPSGAQYIAPPPPGVPGSVTPPASARPLSDFGMPPMTPLATSKRLDEVPAPTLRFDEAIAAPNSVPSSQQPQVNTLPVAPRAPSVVGVAPGSATVGAWLISVLPLLHFAVIYVVFGILAEPFLQGTQWGILAAPAIFSLIFAQLDRRTLLARGHHDAPSTIWAILPPLYLIVRCVRLGAGAVAPLVVWLVLQVAAAVGIAVLLPDIVASVLGTH
jgi:hypothetical protein